MKWLAKWFKKDRKQYLTREEAEQLWLTCPQWLADHIIAIDARGRETNDALVSARAQILRALDLLADQNDHLKQGLLGINDRVNNLELALVDADEALVRATKGQAKDGARH